MRGSLIQMLVRIWEQKSGNENAKDGARVKKDGGLDVDTEEEGYSKVRFQVA